MRVGEQKGDHPTLLPRIRPKVTVYLRETGARLGRIGVEAQNFLEMRNRSLRLTFCHEHVRKQEMRVGEVGVIPKSGS